MAPLTAGHSLRPLPPAGCRRHPRAARNQPAKKAGRPEITPNPRSGGLFQPTRPGPVSESRLRAGKKQQKRRDKPTKGRFANTIKNNKKVSKVRRVPTGPPAVKKQVRRAIYPPADHRTLNRPAPLLFAHTRQVRGFLFFRFFFWEDVLQRDHKCTILFFSSEKPFI